jgi:hypothetical protein
MVLVGNDVAYDEYISRSGMTIVTTIETTNKWIAVYEFLAGNSSSYISANYLVYYRLADSPLVFDSADDTPIVINKEIAPNAPPYAVWLPIEGPNGTVMASDTNGSNVYTNRFGGDPKMWEIHKTSQPGSYSRYLHVFSRFID